jgi:hypothetical protein
MPPHYLTLPSYLDIQLSCILSRILELVYKFFGHIWNISQVRRTMSRPSRHWNRVVCKSELRVASRLWTKDSIFASRGLDGRKLGKGIIDRMKSWQGQGLAWGDINKRLRVPKPGFPFCGCNAWNQQCISTRGEDQSGRPNVYHRVEHLQDSLMNAQAFLNSMGGD